MNKFLNIIEIIDGKYVLNTNLLHSALTTTDNCNNIALISIAGPKSHGKTFLTNCLINYMNSENKDEWPYSEDAFIKKEYYSQKDDNKTPVIKLTSCPFIITDIIENEIIRTAVFLMDSDFVFDNEMSSQQVQDIIALFLLTSSTVIYNHKLYLPKQEFLRLETISSRISYMNKSLDSLKNIFFLIRDWSPETSNNEFSYGLLEGSKYIENLINNMYLDKSYEDLNCFLMSTPELDKQTKLIKLYELNKQFSLDLKSLIVFKLLNIDEMLKKKNPKTDEYINASELFELFEDCVDELNRNIDYNLSIDILSAGVENLNIGDQSRDETDSIKPQTDIEINDPINIFVEKLIPTTETDLDKSIDITGSLKLEENKSFIESNEENHVKRTSNSPKPILVDLTYDDESNSIIWLSSPESAEEEPVYYGDDESFSDLGNSIKDYMSEDLSDSSSSLEIQNIDDYCFSEDSEDSPNTLITENWIETQERSRKESTKNHTKKFKNNLMDIFTEGVEKSAKTSSIEYQYLPTFLNDSNSDSESNHHNKRENNYMSRSFVGKNKANETEIENQFRDIIDELLLEYNTSMEIKLKDQILDLNRDLKKTHEIIKQKIFETFEKKSNGINPSSIASYYRDKYYLELNNKINQAIKTYKYKVEMKLNEAHDQYEKIVKKILSIYKQNMKSSIIDQSENDLHIKSSSHIQKLCKERAINTFKEETVKFLKGNIETEFLGKLNIEMDEMNCDFGTACCHYREYESRRQQIFLNLRYYSDDKIKRFHEIEKSRIYDLMQKLRDPDFIQYTFSLLDKSFNAFKERNKLIEEKERNFALKAIHLAAKIYEDCFEAKLKTGFYGQSEVNDIRDQLLEYTIKELIASCDFNEYQNYLHVHCEDGLILEVQAIHEIKSNDYRKKVEKTDKMLTKAREQALECYRYSMNAKPFTTSKKTYLKSNEFTALHHKYSKIAIEYFNQSVEFLDQDFCPEFANKLLLDNQSLLRNLITNEKQKFKTLNDKNIPDGHSMAIYLGKQYNIAATHSNNRYEIIPDKFDEKLRPNSISFGNEILVGSEAKNHYETLYADLFSIKNFDIKQLLGRERSCIPHDELRAFPFTFLRDKLSIYVDYHDFKTDLSIESLLAFIILDIKSCAEKQIGNIMSIIVLTVPTSFTVFQKNAIRNAAKIAGFEDCDLISEISAAAISYAVERVEYFDNIVDTVLFVIINDYECDVAICYINNKKILYKKYFHQTLNSTEEEKRIFFKKIMKNSRKTEENSNIITEYKFKELIDKVFKKPAFKSSVQIDECVIAGNSILIPEIKIWINKYINPIPLKMRNSMDIIIKGSALYAEMLANKIKPIVISEVTTHTIYLNYETKFSKEQITEVMPKNTPLPNNISIAFNSPKSRDLPLKITVSQGNHIVTTHLINEMPFSNYSDKGYKKLIINFDVDCFGDISVGSVLSKTKYNKGIKLDSIDINPGLYHKDIADEKQKLGSLIDQIQQTIKINEDKLCLGKAISQLSHHCMNVKNEVETNLKLRPLIKKQILVELEKTQSFLNCEHLDLNDIKNQKQMLDKTLEGYKSLLQ